MPSALNNLAGRAVGRLTVLYRVENSPHGNTQWLCLCKCGNTSIVKGSNLNKERTKSCGCAWTDAWQLRNVQKFRDLTSRRFGRLKVIEMVFKRDKALFWRCICDCGREWIVNGKSLKRGLTRSCGCLQRERASKARKRAVKNQPRSHGRFAKASSSLVAVQEVVTRVN